MASSNLHKKWKVRDEILNLPNSYIYASSCPGMASSSHDLNSHPSFVYQKFYPQSLKFFDLLCLIPSSCAAYIYNRESNKSYEISINEFLDVFDPVYLNCVKIWTEINNERRDI